MKLRLFGSGFFNLRVCPAEETRRRFRTLGTLHGNDVPNSLSGEAVEMSTDFRLRERIERDIRSRKDRFPIGKNLLYKTLEQRWLGTRDLWHFGILGSAPISPRTRSSSEYFQAGYTVCIHNSEDSVLINDTEDNLPILSGRVRCPSTDPNAHPIHGFSR